MKSKSLPFTDFGFSGNGAKSARRWLATKGRRYGNCFIKGAGRFSAGNGKLIDSLEIRDFRIGLYERFVSPRVRQRRGRLFPPSVVSAGSRLEATGVSTPPWNSPAASGRNFSHPLFPPFVPVENTFPTRYLVACRLPRYRARIATGQGA